MMMMMTVFCVRGFRERGQFFTPHIYTYTVTAPWRIADFSCYCISLEDRPAVSQAWPRGAGPLGLTRDLACISL